MHYSDILEVEEFAQQMNQVVDDKLPAVCLVSKPMDIYVDATCCCIYI